MADAEATEAPKKKSDLGIRTLSAIVMLAIVIGAFAAGGWWLKGFIYLVALATFGEMARMVLRGGFGAAGKVGWLAFGAAYIGLAAWLMTAGDPYLLLFVVAVVVTVDVSAYFCGRLFGKRKIAPSISPSKTWAGLIGAMVIAGGLVGWFMVLAQGITSGKTPEPEPFSIWPVLAGIAIGALLAAVAQAGDFFESWLKRRAGMKDSSNLIPGHGGVFDRTDGLIPVAIVLGLLFNIGQM